MKSKYGTFPEYHTSLDDLNFVTPKGLAESISIYRHIIELLEGAHRPRAKILGEPQLGRRGLYETLSRKGSASGSMLIRNILAYANGTRDLFELSEKLDAAIEQVEIAVDLLLEHELIE
ncbi:MAG: DUF4910 domain-containing protein [Boseongicola sp.]|nr:MAG: DUF4910 domain-containing protein [Boseongicola sp.]